MHERGLKTVLFVTRYEKDNSKVGVPSDYGKQLMIGSENSFLCWSKDNQFFFKFSLYGSVSTCIGRVPQQDQILYQTERYHTQTFGYDMPVQGETDI